MTTIVDDAEHQTDDGAGPEDHPEVRAGLRERRPDLRCAGLNDREPEHGVEEEAGRGDRRDHEHDRDQDRAAQHVQGLAVQHVRLEVVHRQPDPHRRQDLNEREPPVREQQLEPVEEHHEAADHQRERSEHAPRPTQADDQLLHHRLITIAHSHDELPQPVRQRRVLMWRRLTAIA